MIIVDEEIVTIGSTNFDFRSFECNFESNLFSTVTILLQKMLEIYKTDLKKCARVQPSEWRRRNPGRKDCRIDTEASQPGIIITLF